MVEPWFATSAFGLGRVHEPAGAVDPSMYLVHAKRIGTSRTACGRDASAWRKHWAAFDAVPFDRACPECAAAAGGGDVLA